MNSTHTIQPHSQGRPSVRLLTALFLGMTGLAAHAAPVRYQPVVEKLEARTHECDVAVYGGTPAGVTAAIQAARLGKSVILISFNGFFGGMTSGGLTATDLGDKESIGGMALEFYQRVGNLKGFSPSKAEALYLEMLREAGVTLLLKRPLIAAKSESGRIVSIDLQTRETVRAKVFVDATYEGDLLAAANVSYQVGREPASTYHESLGGQWQEVSWKDVYQFCRLPISPYKDPGDPKSGLLPEIANEPAGKPGEGDFKVQAYNFRSYLSKAADRIPFPRPPGYDPGRYALLARFLHFDPKVEWKLNYTVKPMTDGPVQLRPGDSNNAGSFSTDYVGGNYRWPDGTYTPGSFAKLPPPRRGQPVPLPELYEIREKIFQDHVNYQMGLYHFLANDPHVPGELRERVNKFGLDPKEFQDSGHWPHQLYIREGRRMVSDYVMTQANCEGERIAGDSIGLASYPMDSHFCQRVVVEENGHTTVRNEGGFGHECKNGPYPVSYRAIVPKREECTNLLVPVSLSSSHVAFGSIRMEPVFMILGQSAGTAAVLAIDGSQTVQDVPYEKLKDLLVQQGQRL
jgi:FAD dependent oxidoreductase